jgi:RNAse (barnase) inhibitor barstar
MNTVTVDCEGIENERQFWERYLKLVQPEGAGHFGCNLDAFHDALAGGPGWPGEQVVTFVNTAGLRHLRQGSFLSALVEIASQSRFSNVTFE